LQTLPPEVGLLSDLDLIDFNAELSTEQELNWEF